MTTFHSKDLSLITAGLLLGCSSHTSDQSDRDAEMEDMKAQVSKLRQRADESDKKFKALAAAVSHHVLSEAASTGESPRSKEPSPTEKFLDGLREEDTRKRLEALEQDQFLRDQGAK